MSQVQRVERRRHTGNGDGDGDALSRVTLSYNFVRLVLYTMNSLLWYTHWGNSVRIPFSWYLIWAHTLCIILCSTH